MFFALSGQWCDTQQQWQELSYSDHVRLWCSNDHAYRLGQSPPAASYCVMPCIILFGNKIRNASTCYTCCWNWWPIPLILQAKIFKNWRKLLIEIYMNVLCIYVCCVFRQGNLISSLSHSFKQKPGTSLCWEITCGGLVSHTGGINDSSAYIIVSLNLWMSTGPICLHCLEKYFTTLCVKKKITIKQSKI